MIGRILLFFLSYWPTVVGFAVGGWLIKNYSNKGLNKYPGPLLAALTDWWRFFDVLGRRHEHTQIALHKKHGDIVRLGPNVLAFADPKAIKEIYGLNKGYVKTQFYPVQNNVSAGRRIQSLFSTVDEDYHARFRRCVNNAFAMSSLVSYEPLVDSTTTVFLEQTLKRFCGPDGVVCNFSQWLQFYAFDVIGEITWSKRLGFVERNEDVDGITASITDTLAYAGPIGQQPWLDYMFLRKNPIKMWLMRLGFFNSSSGVAAFASARTAERTAQEKGEKLPSVEELEASHKKSGKGIDFLTRFKQSQIDHPEFMTDFQVLAASTSLVNAGSDTTAISLSAVFYYLLKNRDVYKKLMVELDAAAANVTQSLFSTTTPQGHGLVSWAASQKLPFLDACITEAFRLFPAVGLILERHVPPQGATICGENIPGGTIVGCNAWVLHRRPEIFGEDVDVYRPERWLEATPAKQKGMRATMFQFGAGARTCIGRNISTLEIYKLVPTFLRTFEIEFADPTKDWTTFNAWFVLQRNFDVRFKLRNTDDVRSEKA